jgi:mono/diheme cytochrome c family protein
MHTMSSAATAAVIALLIAMPLRADAAAELYREHCVQCHGEDGKKGKIDLTSAQVQDKTDKVLLSYIADNRGHAYGHKGLRSWQVQSLVDHLRTLAAPSTPETTDTPDQ